MRVHLPDQSDAIMPDLAAFYPPEILDAASAFSAAVYRHSALPPRIFEAARVATAVINGCITCKNFRAMRDLKFLGIEDGMKGEGALPDDAFYQAVLDGDLSGLTDRERLAVRYVQKMGEEPQALAADEVFWAELKSALSDSEIVDLTYCAASWIGLGRATHVLGVDAACALPTHERRAA